MRCRLLQLVAPDLHLPLHFDLEQEIAERAEAAAERPPGLRFQKARHFNGIDIIERIKDACAVCLLDFQVS